MIPPALPSVSGGLNSGFIGSRAKGGSWLDASIISAVRTTAPVRKGADKEQAESGRSAIRAGCTWPSPPRVPLGRLGVLGHLVFSDDRWTFSRRHFADPNKSARSAVALCAS